MQVAEEAVKILVCLVHVASYRILSIVRQTRDTRGQIDAARGVASGRRVAVVILGSWQVPSIHLQILMSWVLCHRNTIQYIRPSKTFGHILNLANPLYLKLN